MGYLTLRLGEEGVKASIDTIGGTQFGMCL